MATGGPDRKPSLNSILTISRYPVVPGKPLARGILFLNTRFTHPGFQCRRGSEKDEDLLVKPLEERGVKFVVYHDKTADEIRQIIAEFSDDAMEHFSAFVFAMSSHAERDFLYASDGGAIHIQTEIILPFGKCKGLQKKPKIYILQGCQTIPKSPNQPALQQRGSKPSYYQDTCVAFPQPAGFKAYRSVSEGSVLLNIFNQVLRKYSEQRDIVQLLTKVTKEAARSTGEEDHESVPEIQSTLTDRFFLKLPESMQMQNTQHFQELSLIESSSIDGLLTRTQSGKLHQLITIVQPVAQKNNVPCVIYSRNDENQWSSSDEFNIRPEQPVVLAEIIQICDDSSFILSCKLENPKRITEILKVDSRDGKVLKTLVPFESNAHDISYDKYSDETWLSITYSVTRYSSEHEKLHPDLRWSNVTRPGRISSSDTRIAVMDLYDKFICLIDRSTNDVLGRVKSIRDSIFELDSRTERLFVYNTNKKTISALENDGKPLKIPVTELEFTNIPPVPTMKRGKICRLVRDQHGAVHVIERKESNVNCVYDITVLLHRIYDNHASQQNTEMPENDDATLNTSFPSQCDILLRVPSSPKKIGSIIRSRISEMFKRQ